LTGRQVGAPISVASLTDRVKDVAIMATVWSRATIAWAIAGSHQSLLPRMISLSVPS